MLDQLIDEQIVAQKAVAAKLDKDPKVIAQIEAARRDILARRFLESAAETAGKPADDAVQKFYDGRPALFAQRKVYTLQRIDIQAPDDRRTEVDAHVQSLKTLGRTHRLAEGAEAAVHHQAGAGRRPSSCRPRCSTSWPR